MLRLITMTPILVYISVALVCLWVLASRKRQRYRYPPGPKGLPILGNVLDIPTGYGWFAYRDWARQYDSDIIHLQGLGMHIVVLNSAKAAKDLFDKRHGIYSDKELTSMLLEVTGPYRNWSMMQYGDYWRDHRRLFHQHFRPLAVPQYHPKRAKAVHRLLQLLLDSRTGDDFVHHVRYFAGSLILDVVYAFDVRPDDLRLEIVEKAMRAGYDIINAGVFLADVFPILRHVPAWFPGARFKRQAAEWKALVDDMYEVPYGQFKATMNEGSAQQCFALSLLSDADAKDMSRLDEIIKSLTGTAYAAGSDTTVIAAISFIFAMVLNPDIQAFVQEELDRVVATPHRAMFDDEYNGYHIPAGSVVMGNTWAILHDEETYPDPYSFNPKRFLSADGMLRDDVPLPTETFGYGRRICPGRYFAMDTMFLIVSSLLAVFNIEKAVDEHGKVIEVKEGFTKHVISAPKPFKACFKPRHPGAESLIRSAVLADA
ncbi:uncharacterized protein PHACADRAFT_209397 [Phanerochaete carnosa HHB-10118-sp]|uniref:Cytochrome P450 n=1 Tax=Phanerochaete carnosa (strain HHB-10118-sp) TaxID=650164 RepID=K5W9M0_PHACS|nr:uncharacterized protein PHACADRAFT_209397 [Phanerochaete carnosa HHB-10118-sp]EKM55885.1 hypothetical protein PHACADRAFT_209397 [Phanerochaete carnosa HHB-10118-sp]